MRRFGTVSYNMHCSFTNYGSALQTYALQRAINEISPGEIEALVIDYCPDALKDRDVLDPYATMWDADEESRRMVELTMPAIRENAEKFDRFYHEVCKTTDTTYDSSNFEESLSAEGLDGYVCGSDTIFCIREFGGFDDGYYANYPSMRDSHTVSYAASFGDVDWTPAELRTLKKRLQNFKAIGIREDEMIGFIRENVDVPIAHTVDPTLLLEGKDYACITAEPQMDEPYVLLYSRRYSPDMEAYADRVADELGCRVVEISLRATNAERGHVMRYDAGVEEYLSLVEHAQYMVTNSYHGLIFAVQKHTPFAVFSREQADTKIDAILSWIGLTGRKIVARDADVPLTMDYGPTDERLAGIRATSKKFLTESLLSQQ